MRPLIATVTALLVLTGLSACQTAHVSRGKAIEASLYAYEKSVRWEGPREGYRFLRPDLQPGHIPAWIDKIRVVGYDVLDPPHEVGEDQVAQRVRIQYVNQDTQVIRTLTDEQMWESADGGKTWQRINPIPSYY